MGLTNCLLSVLFKHEKGDWNDDECGDSHDWKEKPELVDRWWNKGVWVRNFYLNTANTNTVLHSYVDVASFAPFRSPRISYYVIRSGTCDTKADHSNRVVKWWWSAIRAAGGSVWKSSVRVLLEFSWWRIDCYWDRSAHSGCLELKWILGHTKREAVCFDDT